MTRLANLKPRKFGLNNPLPQSLKDLSIKLKTFDQIHPSKFEITKSIDHNTQIRIGTRQPERGIKERERTRGDGLERDRRRAIAGASGASGKGGGGGGERSGGGESFLEAPVERGAGDAQRRGDGEDHQQAFEARPRWPTCARHLLLLLFLFSFPRRLRLPSGLRAQ